MKGRPTIVAVLVGLALSQLFWALALRSEGAPLFLVGSDSLTRFLLLACTAMLYVTCGRKP